jgi:very-short-patch-repair endonuclease
MKQRDFARQLRGKQTDTESLLWSRLRAHRLFGLKFRRQQPIGVYIVDFLCPEKKLIVELDGGQHQDRAEYDEARDAWLKSEGYTVLRDWNNEVMGNLEGVLEDIGQVAGVFTEASPSPQPLPPQGGGA